MYTNFHQHVLDLEEKPHRFKVREVKYPHRKGGWSQRVCTISSVTARHSSLTVLWAPKPTKQKRGVYTRNWQQEPSPELLNMGRWRWGNRGSQSSWNLPMLKTAEDQNQKLEKVFHYGACWSIFIQQSQLVNGAGSKRWLRESRGTVGEAFRGWGIRRIPGTLKLNNS